MTQHKQSHRIKWRDHHIKWHDMTCHVATNQSTSPPRHLTTNHITSSHPASNFMTSKQVTSPPWNSRRLLHSKEMVWASCWSVPLRTFYGQILSLLNNSFFFWNFRPRLAWEVPVYVYLYVNVYTCICFNMLHLFVSFVERCLLCMEGAEDYEMAPKQPVILAYGISLRANSEVAKQFQAWCWTVWEGQHKLVLTVEASCRCARFDARLSWSVKLSTVSPTWMLNACEQFDWISLMRPCQFANKTGLHDSDAAYVHGTKRSCRWGGDWGRKKNHAFFFHFCQVIQGATTHGSWWWP